MSEALFRLEHDALSAAALIGFRGHEAISRCFAIDVFVSLPDPSALDDVLGSALTLRFEVTPAYTLNGVVAEVELLHELPERSLARLRIVPKLWLLGLSHHSRMFVDQTIPEIVAAVLSAAGLARDVDFELRLGAEYAKEEHVCQYQESDLAFVERWLGHEGIHYFFEHDEQAHKLVITDGSDHPSLGDRPIRYHPVGRGQPWGQGAFQRFSAQRSERPRRVKLVDYDYAKPDLDVAGDAQVLARGQAEVQRFGDDRFFDPGRGQALAQVRAEQLMVRQGLHRAQGTALHLRAGYRFEVEGHPIGALNKTILCVELEHHANLGARTVELARLTGLEHEETYRTSVLGIDAGTKVRPVQTAGKPRVYGYLTGVVDGAADGDYAQLDADGRYHVVLHFDESGLGGGKASTRLRMMQPHAGNPEGQHFPLRKGTEVMVAFLDGDPDRPLIVGAVPNAHNPSVVNSSNHTHNVIHTGGDNHFDFEDKKDGQWIWFFCPTEESYLHLGKPHQGRTHHIVLHTKGNNLFDYGTNQDITVGGKLEETVEGPVTETYKAEQTSQVVGAQTTTVDAQTEETYGATQQTITIGQVTENYEVPQLTTVNAAPRQELFLASQTTQVSGGGLTQQLNDSHTRTVLGSSSSTLTGTYTRHATGATTQIFGGNVLRLWGPHTADFQSLNLLVPGGVNDVHVGYTLLVPGDCWCEPTTTYVAVFKCKVRMLQYALVGPKAEAIGLGVCGISIKREATGTSRQVNGVNIDVALSEGEGNATYNGHHAFCILP
jgi:type VI secretion system secreted protein VgrG